MKMNASPRKVLFWSAGAIALAVLAWLAMREPVQMASVAQVSRGPLEQSFLEEGKTRLKQRYVVTAPLAGVVRRITLQPGDAVLARQVVAEIDPTGSALLDPRARSQALAEVSTGESALRAASPARRGRHNRRVRRPRRTAPHAATARPGHGDRIPARPGPHPGRHGERCAVHRPFGRTDHRAAPAGGADLAGRGRSGRPRQGACRSPHRWQARYSSGMWRARPPWSWANP